MTPERGRKAPFACLHGAPGLTLAPTGTVGTDTVTNTLAIILAGLVLAGLGLDYLLGTGAGLFLARRFLDLVDWMVFW